MSGKKAVRSRSTHSWESPENSLLPQMGLKSRHESGLSFQRQVGSFEQLAVILVRVKVTF